MPGSVRICSFQAGPEVVQRVGRRARYLSSYEELRAAVLKAGRFSAFEATASARAAALYTQLCQDPTVETKPLGFPWTSAREREAK
jgi:hypothetical protein